MIEPSSLLTASAPAPTAPGGAARTSDDALRETAREFEAAFLAEMLKAAKLGEVKGPFTGGHGEEAFRSFLVREYADEMSRAGGIGLADKLYAEFKQKVTGHAE